MLAAARRGARVQRQLHGEPTNTDTARTNTDAARTNTDGPLLHQELTQRIIAAFLRVYDSLGFGFLESVYCNALAHQLAKAGISFEREVAIDVWYDGIRVGHFRADFLIEGKVVLEIKASQALGPADRKQLMNYLRGTDVELGLLLHFGPRVHFERVLYTNDRKQRQQRRTPT